MGEGLQSRHGEGLEVSPCTKQGVSKDCPYTTGEKFYSQFRAVQRKCCLFKVEEEIET